MKILSLWEPWATLMAIGAKTIETRSWMTDYRGWIAIHATKGGLSKSELASVCSDEPFHSALWTQVPAAIPGFIFPHGCIVGVVRLQTCWPANQIHLAFRDRLTETERAFGNYEPSRYGWLTCDPFRLPDPIDYKADRVRLRDVPPAIFHEIQKQAKRSGVEYDFTTESGE